MKYIKKNLLILFMFLFSFVPNLSIANHDNVVLRLPKADWQTDINIENPQIESKESTIFGYIKKINYYLWFSIALISMAVLIYAGILMITAGGDKAKVSKGGKLALSCLIAIIVSMLSYALVNLIIGLF